jgi:carboxyl-terminal processing protease
MSNDAPNPELTEDQRRQIFNAVLSAIEKHFYLPSAPTPDIRALRERHEESIIQATKRENFESLMQNALGSVAGHHLGFFHARRARTSASAALAARAVPATSEQDGPRWRFQFVQEAGPADKAGIAVGDLLLTLDGQDIIAPQRMFLEHGRSYAARVRKVNGLIVESVITIPIITDRRKAPPVITPSTPVTASKIGPDMGLIRISSFPGVVGIDVSNDITNAVNNLSCSRLIWDVRGNSGGGMGALRAMGHLCPDRRPVGHSVSRSAIERGYRKEDLPRFDRIPRSKLGLLPIVTRYLYWKLTGRGDAVALFTEGLGRQKHHGHSVVLIDQNSASAAEMFAAFASENQLATLVGTATPGRLAQSSIRKLPFDYRLMLPTGGYVTWRGTALEPGKGVKPDIEVSLDPDSLLTPEDSQLSQARAVLSSRS